MIPDREKLIFTRNVAVMVKSGIPLVESVRSYATQTQHPAFRKVLSRVVADVEAGQKFSFALQRHPSAFSLFYVNAVKAGEKSGSLERNLDYIAEQIEAHMIFKKALTSALLYPLFLVVAVSAVAFLLSWLVLPTITDLLKSFTAEPTLSTKLVIGIGSLVEQFGIFIVLGVVVCFTLAYASAQTSSGKEVSDWVLLRLPVFGKVFRQVYLVETSKTLSTLLKSGVPVHESLSITAESLGNTEFRRAIRQVIPYVLKGNPISPFFNKRLFPPLFIQMMEVGEKSARIEQNLDFLASFGSAGSK